MTKEEAISLLSQVNHILVNSNSWLENTHEPLNIAFDMAIKALEQEPCEDCVSRQSVHDGMIKYEFHSSDMTITEFVKDVLPPVTPTRKRGKWVKTGQSFIDPNKFLCYSCSECEFDVGKVKTRFCPNCGAEMEE
jgi:hypothetical protein